MPAVNGNLAKAYLDGSWRDWAAVQGNVDGTWRLASDVYVNKDGVWTQVWVRLTAPTNGSVSLNHVTATISWTAGVGQDGFKLYRNGVFVKNVTGTSTTDVVPTMQTNYTYSVSAYAGSTETAQITCGTVNAGVGSTSLSLNVYRDWTYVNDSWDNIDLLFTANWLSVANASGYEWRVVDVGSGGVSTGLTTSVSQNLGAGPSTVKEVTVRAYVNHNGVTYYGAYSNKGTLNAGRPLVRTARTDNIPFDAWADQERYYTAFGAFDRLDTSYTTVGTIVDSYQFRDLTAAPWSSQITSSTRTIEISIPGPNIFLTTAGIGNGWDSAVLTNYADQRYRVDPQGSGWFNYDSANKLSGIIRFNTRYISQTAIAFTIGYS